MTKAQTRKNIKRDAKHSLSGHWGKAIGVLFLVLAVTIGLSLVTTVGQGVSKLLNTRAYTYCDKLSGGALDRVVDGYVAENFALFAEPYLEEVRAAIGEEMYGIIKETALSSAKQEIVQGGNYFGIIATLSEGGAEGDLAAAAAVTASADVAKRMLISGAIICAVGLLVFAVNLLVNSSLAVGETNFFVRFSEDSNTPISRLFDWFAGKKMFKALGINVIYGLVCAVPVLIAAVLSVFAAVGTAVAAYFAYAGNPLMVEEAMSTDIALAGMGAVLVILIAGSVFSAVLSIKYSPYMYMLVKFDGVKNSKIFSQSGRLMKGHKWEYFVFELSFLGWWVLTGLTFGALALYAEPYYYVSKEKFFAYIYETGLEKGICEPEFIPAEPEPVPEITDFDGFDAGTPLGRGGRFGRGNIRGAMWRPQIKD